MGCLCCASKVEEAPRRIRDIISVFEHIKQVREGRLVHLFTRPSTFNAFRFLLQGNQASASRPELRKLEKPRHQGGAEGPQGARFLRSCKAPPQGDSVSCFP